MLLQKLRFRTKLFVGFAVIILLIAIISTLSLFQLNKIKKNTELIYEHPLTVSNTVRDINIYINGMHRSMKDVVLAENIHEIDSAVLIVNRLNQQVIEAFDLVFDRFLGDVNDVKIAYQAFIDWEVIRNEVIKLKRNGNDLEAAKITKEKGADYVKSLFDKTKIMTDFAQKKANEFKVSSEKTYISTFNFLLLSIITVIGLSIFIAVFIGSSIVLPIKNFITEIRSLYSKEESVSDKRTFSSEEDLLTITVSELKNAYQQIQDFNTELKTLNEDLDEKVKERTAELEKNQYELKEKNEEYLAINEEYELLNEELNQTNKDLVFAKEKAEESELRYKVLHNASFGGITIHDKGIILDCNQGLSEITGYSYEELIGMDGLLLIAEDSREMVMDNIKAEYEEPYEAIGVRKNGDEYPVRLEARMIPYNDKKVRVVEFRDITQQKKAEKDLIESELRFRKVIELSPFPIMIHAEGEVIHLSNAWTEITGYKKEDISTIEKWSEKAYGKEVVPSIDFIHSLYKLESVQYDGEWEIKINDGKTRIWDFMTVPLGNLYDGRRAVVSMAVDITERKKSEEAVLKSEQKLRDLFNNMDAGIVVHAPDTSIIYNNIRAEELLGFSNEQMRGKQAIDPAWKFLDESNNPLPFEEYPVNKTIKEGPIKNRVVGVIQSNDSDVFWLLVNGFPIINNQGKITEVIISFIDITELKRAEEKLKHAKEKAETNESLVKESNEEYLSINEELRQTIEELSFAKERAEESDRLKSAFLTNMSHEIRTPMNGIIGFAKLLQKQELSKEKLEDYVNIIVQSSNQLLSIVDDILDISRIETGQVDLYENKINLNVSLEEIKTFFELKMAEKGLKLNLQTDLENSDSNILIDESKLKQIIFNLIGNAFKFTEKGAIDFGYKLKEQRLEFFVKDSGIGISKQNQKDIFDRFNKVHHEANVIYGGTGLGLAICKGLVEKMSGEVWVESKLGEGATFYFTLPFVKVTDSKQKFTIKEADIDIFNSKILIVEDEEFNSIYLKEILDKRNIKFIHVWDGEEAVRICSGDENIDLVLMDIKLPKMDGYTATKKIKKIRPELPIIAQTAYAMVSDRKKALEAGCDDYISKPIDEEHLVGMFEKYLKK